MSAPAKGTVAMPISDSAIIMLLEMRLGFTQLRYSASQCRVFAWGSVVLAVLLVCGFSALRAEKPHTIETKHAALPKAE
jgi:hypothetical protein